MKDRMAFASESGCDAVEVDNVDAFENTEETHSYVTYKDQLNYNKWLANTAHQFNLAIGLKNDIQQLKELVDYFDFAVNEQCFAYSNECIRYESTFLKAGKAVFNQAR
ncbi:endo alpha-1,4 polygalactosaminidase [Spartinivicinus poritis]|uniref:Endo alpha-1,4 polygalactosaminidase n=1 Tax=Spartinivicinus poritis TaxID=2994640 RepID=A0ABT5UD43_9GAMM|nr:endo alpha-1,4 polygalactosaminidase [Spartinivicinus sp. A2-2]MDE1464299.1 endo alpha-1,4 polygalactosaminidase [Spartinivicinus sp. A2-2]